MKCKAAAVMLASAGRCVAGPWMRAIVESPLFVMVHWTGKVRQLSLRPQL